ncbi:MAG: substrate-binding domain-containing protein, partial [Microcystaceae cyanobacterium]
MFKKKIKPPLYLALLVAVAAASLPLAVSLKTEVVLAQSPPAAPSVALPTVPSDTVVRIQGSDSVEKINQDLKQQFEGKYPGTKVETGVEKTDTALQAVRDGKIDLAAIGRPLTAGEKAENLIAVPIHRRKIAMIVSRDNPFKGDLTFEQFAQIFRGEIKDWSQVGGPAGKIRFIDRPETSDTRQSFQDYPVFQNTPFKAGSDAVTLSEDNTDEAIAKLGKDGIGYAIVDQVQDRQDVHIVPMNKVLPSDPRYPFSQPLSYVYKGENPNPNVKSFLCYANTTSYAADSPDGTIVSTSFCREETAPVAAKPAPGPFPWGWVLLPLIGL